MMTLEQALAEVDRLWTEWLKNPKDHRSWRNFTVDFLRHIYAHEPPAQEPANGARVRVAVAVDITCRWNAIGYYKWGDTATEEAARRGWSDSRDVRLSWLTATVPLPAAPAEIEAAVEAQET